MIRRRVIVHGRVQGVFFRDTTRTLAIRHRVGGSVANRPDGAVEAIFEGSAEGVEALVEFCRHGPDRAEVERIEVIEEQPEGLEGFRVV